ncbi:hypothetical protein FB451DRAFT_1496620 [Mycena latifolia]|nr:hypothetical protein FB451DRAFT_1496620 [Mycena latifolia]
MRSFTTLVVALSLVAAHAAVLNPTPRTNAERFASGMGPLKPRKMYSSRTLSARAGTPSNTPAGTLIQGTGNAYSPGTSVDTPAERRNAKRAGDFLGYIDNVLGLSSTSGWRNQLTYNVPSDPTTPVAVKGPQYYGTTAGEDFTIAAGVMGGWLDGTNADGTHIYHKYDIVVGSTNYLRFGSLMGTLTALPDGGPANSPAVYDTMLSQWEEYAVFQIAPETGIVTIKWQNLDGSTPELTLCVATTTVGGRRIIGTVDQATTEAYLAVAGHGQSDGIYETLSDCGLTLVFDVAAGSATT